ncbi:hypothetical protein [Shinella sp. JR1-6]|uniref:hypothetical protein n=1 Tax=Shinella sp. JR1-6 TaxID=2527671 RepID=UPI001404592D|nr:hypothetical protein [Shinella sp. JR1-6]
MLLSACQDYAGKSTRSAGELGLWPSEYFPNGTIFVSFRQFGRIVAGTQQETNAPCAKRPKRKRKTRKAQQTFRVLASKALISTAQRNLHTRKICDIQYGATQIIAVETESLCCALSTPKGSKGSRPRRIVISNPVCDFTIQRHFPHIPAPTKTVKQSRIVKSV